MSQILRGPSNISAYTQVRHFQLYVMLLCELSENSVVNCNIVQYRVPTKANVSCGLGNGKNSAVRLVSTTYLPHCQQDLLNSAGGRGVIEGLGKQLGLSKSQVEPSFNSLYWYGNTSSASIWYALGYIETCQKVRRGDRVWQVRDCTDLPLLGCDWTCPA